MLIHLLDELEIQIDLVKYLLQPSWKQEKIELWLYEIDRKADIYQTNLFKLLHCQILTVFIKH